MKRAFKAEEMLDLADTLAGRDSGRGRPRTVFLRRSVSTAYYALFHELVLHGTHRLAPRGNVEHQQAIGRWYAHGNVKKACQWVEALATNRTPPAPVGLLLSEQGTVPRDLEVLATAFLGLQQARHDADYNPAYDVTKSAALTHAGTARAAVEAARRLERAGSPAYDMFLLLSLGGDRLLRNN